MTSIAQKCSIKVSPTSDGIWYWSHKYVIRSYAMQISMQINSITCIQIRMPAYMPYDLFLLSFHENNVELDKRHLWSNAKQVYKPVTICGLDLYSNREHIYKLLLSVTLTYIPMHKRFTDCYKLWPWYTFKHKTDLQSFFHIWPWPTFQTG